MVVVILLQAWGQKDGPDRKYGGLCKLYDPTNKKVLDKMKDESIDKKGVHYIKEIAALRSKLYAFIQTLDDEEHKRCKGVKSSVVKKILNYRNIT